MAVQVNPITQSLPATTAIQDPATRRFAQAVEDALRALRSEEGAVESLKKAADAMNNAVAGGTPPSIAQWLFSSELYQKLTTEIARVDTQAKQDVLDEALARSQAIQEIQAALAEIESTPAYDPATTYQIGDLVTYDNKLYRAKAETTGNPPTNTTYWDKVGDYASLGDVVAAHTLQLSEIESDITDIGGDLAAEITARDTLATQLRGTYAGTDVEMVSQGLLYSERQARITEDGVTVSNLNALRAQVGVTEAGALTEGFILTEQTIRNTNDLAIVSAVNTALAQITGVSTSISQSGENLIANWTTAQAHKWSQIEAEVLTAGGQTIRAALQQESNARSTLAGQVSASWMVKAEVDVGTGKPYVAGIALGAEGQGGAATSEFNIRADKFAMFMPGYGEHVPFAIGPSGAIFTGNTYGAGAPNNLIPDDGFYIPGWWQGNRAATTWPAGWTPQSWWAGGQPARMLLIDSSAGTFDKSSEWFDIRQGAQYRVRLRMYLSPDFSGFIAPLVHFPGVVWGIPGSAVSDPLGQFPAGHTGESWGRGGWVEREAIYTAVASNCTRLQTRLCGRVTAGRAELYLEVTSLFAGLDQITSSNVTTYIDNAALGNAQIGGNLWSTNWNYAGGTGWLLDRSGNFYGNNIYARGDIEASSLKAGVAMVDALNIKGSAMIVPIFISHGNASWDMPYSQGTWQAMEVWKYTLTTGTVGTFRFSFGGLWSITHWTGHANWPTGTVDKQIQILVNGSVVETVAQDATYSGIISGFNIGDRFYTLGAGTHTISVYMRALMADGGARFSRTAGSTTIQSHSQGASSI